MVLLKRVPNDACCTIVGPPRILRVEQIKDRRSNSCVVNSIISSHTRASQEVSRVLIDHLSAGETKSSTIGDFEAKIILVTITGRKNCSATSFKISVRPLGALDKHCVTTKVSHVA